MATDDKPFDFNLDGYLKTLDLQPFRFHFSDRRWEMVHFDALDSKDTQDAIETGEDRALLELAMGAEQFGEFDLIPVGNGGLREMVRRYFKHCGIDAGKLLGSTRS